MSEKIPANRWMITVRVIMVLLGILQAALIGWAKYITTEVEYGKVEMAQQKSDITHIGNDVSYIRNRLDSLFEMRRK